MKNYTTPIGEVFKTELANKGEDRVENRYYYLAIDVRDGTTEMQHMVSNWQNPYNFMYEFDESEEKIYTPIARNQAGAITLGAMFLEKHEGQQLNSAVVIDQYKISYEDKAMADLVLIIEDDEE